MYKYIIKMNMNYIAMADKQSFLNDTESTGEIYFLFFMFTTETVPCIISCMIEWTNTFVLFSISLCIILVLLFKNASNKICFRKYTNK